MTNEDFNNAVALVSESPNINVKHPSITEKGEYYGGVAPKADPEQGFPAYIDDDDWEDISGEWED